MNKISYIYLIAMPYFILCLLLLVVKHEVSGTSVLLFVILSALLCLIGVAACIICNLASLTALSDKSSAVRNIVIKCCHIPAHFAVLMLVSGFMNPFLLWASWIPALCGVGLLWYSAFTNIGACVSLVRRKKCSLKIGIVLCILSFVYIADIAAAVVQLKKSNETADNNS